MIAKKSRSTRFLSLSLSMFVIFFFFFRNPCKVIRLNIWFHLNIFYIWTVFVSFFRARSHGLWCILHHYTILCGTFLHFTRTLARQFQWLTQFQWSSSVFIIHWSENEPKSSDSFHLMWCEKRPNHLKIVALNQKCRPKNKYVLSRFYIRHMIFHKRIN